MAVIITPQSEINKYFNSLALSQSLLKKLLGGIDSFKNNKKKEKELYYTENEQFIIGSAVDCILTGEEGEFDRQYYVSQIEKKPSEVEMSIIQKAFDNIIENNSNSVENIIDLGNYKDAVESSIEEHNWQPNWKIDTKINKIVDIGSIYFEDLKAGYGKQLLTTFEKSLIDDIVNSLVNNPRTSKFFNREALSKDEQVTVYYQLPVYFNYKDIECKALIDMLVVVKNKSGKIISVQLFDLKTMNGNTLHFISSLKKYRYDIQLAFYQEAILESSRSLFNLSRLQLSKVLQPFTFIVESNTFPGQPLIFEADKQLSIIGKYGKADIISKEGEILKHGVKGFRESVDTYIYQTKNEWREEQIITDNDGKFKLNWNGIIN